MSTMPFGCQVRARARARAVADSSQILVSKPLGLPQLVGLMGTRGKRMGSAWEPESTKDSAKQQRPRLRIPTANAGFNSGHLIWHLERASSKDGRGGGGAVGSKADDVKPSLCGPGLASKSRE
eukprot:scaffold1878_cov258-Pinguiococcus_pyrenoidosus.AAC.20